jgi:hypothetical protein
MMKASLFILPRARRRLAVFLFLAVFHAANPASCRDGRWNPAEPPRLAAADSFSFVVIGDRTGSGPDSWAVLDWAVSETNLLRPAFAVHIGDLIEGGTTAMAIRLRWDEALDHLKGLTVPLYLVPGNHDAAGSAGVEEWTRRFGEPYRTFDLGGCRFVLMNTEIQFRTRRMESQPSDSPADQGTARGPDPGFGGEQLAWIRRAILKPPKPRHLFVFMHQPAWLFSGDLKAQWEALAPDFSPVPYSVVAGHLHLLAFERRPGGTLCIVGPAGGSLRLAPNPGLGLLEHITRVSVRGDSVRFDFLSRDRSYSEAAAAGMRKRGLETLLMMKRMQAE